MPTDTSEQGLEALITRAMTGRTHLLEPPHQTTSTAVPVSGGTGWLLGDPRHYDRNFCLDLVQLQGFLEATQPTVAEAVQISVDGPTRRQFLTRLEKQIGQRGVVDVLRKGIRHGPHEIQLFYGTPSPGNTRAAELFAQNRFSLTRQLAYSATPKPKTLELFGIPLPPDGEGKIGRRPFHVYTMKQAIEEQFILNVLDYYMPISSYYRLAKTIEADPLFDSKRARGKLRRYVESHETAIRSKAEIMVDHFLDDVLPLREMKGEARAIVVTGGIERAVQYFGAFRTYLAERRSPYLPIVAFSGVHDFGDGPLSEASLNGFPSSEITSRIQDDPYRFLICADKFQTGYDEPLLQAMYVDKPLGGIQAVQTLSRLNRAAPGKKRVFVLDFQDNADAVQAAFADYYKTTLLSQETDSNKLHDLRNDLDKLGVYTWSLVEEFVALFLSNSDRDALQPILNHCRQIYSEQLNEDDQVAFKSKAKAFVRSYDFLATILTYANPEWEKLSIFLTLLVRALPAPEEDDLTKGMLELIDMESYRIDKQKPGSLPLPDDDATLDPAPVSGGGFKPEPALDPLSVIVTNFNEQYGTSFNDEDRIRRLIRDEIAPQVAQDQCYRNAKANTPNTAEIELDAALNRVVDPLFLDQTEFYKQFKDNDLFRNFVRKIVKKLITD
jgi:type I restriction enzyme R subunit